jgi:DNA-directed RNA polymerase specialized sigma24 family protein
VLDRAEHLAPEERRLIEALYAEGLAMSRVAALAGVTPQAMRRRISRIAARSMSPEFTFVAARCAGWRGTRRAVGRACMLHGLSQREAARRLGLSLHVVRRQCFTIRGMLEDAS